MERGIAASAGISVIIMIWFGITFAALCIVLIVLLFIQYKRFSSLLNEQSAELDNLRTLASKSTATITRMTQEKETLQASEAKLTEEKFHMAEANLDLLAMQEKFAEKTGILEADKFKLAEANIKLMEITEDLQREQEKSNRLLRNILPERVIKDLSDKGESTPEIFENVTVFFSDIVGFTYLSSILDPAFLISELNDIFTNFDHIFTRNGCERIKTIGDAYLSVSGMPDEDPRHYANILNSALEARDYLHRRNHTSVQQWQMRMGVHSGRVIGGIVGVEKYIYDVFGDTINTAARMETHSSPDKINVSAVTASLADNEFIFTAREIVDVKGKGPMQMYFLEGRKP